MRITSLAAAAALALAITVSLNASVPNGVRGVVNQKLEGVGDYNQALEDAMNGNDNKPPAPAPVAGAVKEGWITRKSHDGKDVRLYFAYPQGLTKAKPTAALLLLHESFGLNDEMQERARTLAGKGFYTLIPDFYYGKNPNSPDQINQMKNALTDAAAMTAMKTGLDLFQEEETNGIIDAKRVGVIGWDIGGKHALLLSVSDPHIKATAIFYGSVTIEASRLKSLQGPVLGIFGKDDLSPSTKDVQIFQEALKNAGKTDVAIYQENSVGHDFATKSSGNTYDPARATDALNKLDTWLDAKLGH